MEISLYSSCAPCFVLAPAKAVGTEHDQSVPTDRTRAPVLDQVCRTGGGLAHSSSSRWLFYAADGDEAKAQLWHCTSHHSSAGSIREMTTQPLRAALIRCHRPSRGSCETAAASVSPELLSSSPLIKPHCTGSEAGWGTCMCAGAHIYGRGMWRGQ